MTPTHDPDESDDPGGWIVRGARVAIERGRYSSLTGRVVSVGTGTVLVRLDAGHDVNVNVHNLIPEGRLQEVVAAAHDLLDEDRTSWSPEHDRLARALAAIETRPEVSP